MNARIKTFPKHLIRASAESLFSYLEDKYKLRSNIKDLHDIKKIGKELINLLKKLDKINFK